MNNTAPTPKIEAMLALLEQLVAAKEQKSFAWDRVIAEATQYAMMKQFGRYIERSNGMESIIRVNDKDKGDYVKLFTDNLLRAVEDAFIEEAIAAACPRR